MSEPEPWTLRIARIEIAECPDCGFTFDAAHTDEGGTNYSCPCCAEARLTAALRTVERERDEARMAHAEEAIRRAEAEEAHSAAFEETVELLSALREQVARLEQDKARLDWLSTHGGVLHGWFGDMWQFNSTLYRDLRKGIDVAMFTPTENGHER